MKRRWLAVIGRWLVVVGLGALVIGQWPGAIEAEGPNVPVVQTAQGQQIYEERCAACHGINGDGQGPGAARLLVKPRDFTRDEFKIKSTQGDEFPSREDLIKVISEGMPGSSMPGWENVLTQADMGPLADYIQTFGRFFAQEGYGSTIIEIPDRVEPTAESIARGRVLYEGDIECLKCHGEAGRGDGPSAFELTDNAGNVIYPADLTQPWTFRGGSDPEDIYLRLRTGLTGSPMPSFADALSVQETWSLVNYILSLSVQTSSEPAVLLVSRFTDASLPDDPDDPLWSDLPPAYYPLIGQIMRTERHFQPAINAVEVKTLFNATEIAFHVSWNDRTESRTGTGTDANASADALAVQFPQELSDGSERPYFVFGDTDRPVYQMYWAANEDEVIERNGHGLNAIEEQPNQDTTVTSRYTDGRWQLVFRRKLQTGDGNDVAFEPNRYIPISLMAWDSFADEVDGRLGLNGWSTVFLQPPTPLVQYAWIPGVMVGVFVAELLMIWFVRRMQGVRSKE